MLLTINSDRSACLHFRYPLYEPSQQWYACISMVERSKQQVRQHWNKQMHRYLCQLILMKQIFEKESHSFQQLQLSTAAVCYEQLEHRWRTGPLPPFISPCSLAFINGDEVSCVTSVMMATLG